MYWMYEGEVLTSLTLTLKKEKPSQTFDSPMRTHYCWLYVFKTLWHETIPPAFILLLSLNALQHLCVSLNPPPTLTVIALLHRPPWKWIFKCESPSTFPTLHPSLPDFIWTRTLLLYSHACYAPHYVVEWKNPTKSLLRFPSKKRLLLWTPL